MHNEEWSGGQGIAAFVCGLLLCVVVLLLYLALTCDVVASGYYVDNGFGNVVGSNCLYVDVPYGPDSPLFCSDDIYAVMDAERRYRSMPLGELRRRTK